MKCTEPEQLLQFLSSSKDFSMYPNKNLENRKVVSGVENIVKTSHICFNCHERGHIAPNCPKPKLKCTACDKFGHKTENCRTKTQNKTTMAINSESSNSKYFRIIKVNDKELQAFVDLGSEVSIIRNSDLYTLGLTLEPTQIKTLKVFGNSVIPTLGQVSLMISVDEVEGEVSAVVVEDQYINVPILIGQDFTDQNHIVIVKDSTKLSFFLLQSQLPTVDSHIDHAVRLKLCKDCQVDVCVDTLFVLEVYSDPLFEGNLIIESAVIGSTGYEIMIRGGIYSLDKFGKGFLYAQ